MSQFLGRIWKLRVINDLVAMNHFVNAIESLILQDILQDEENMEFGWEDQGIIAGKRSTRHQIFKCGQH